MVGQPEVPNYDPIVYQLEVTDPVQGGQGGVANEPLLQLADRTAWLKQQIDGLFNGTLRPSWIAALNGSNFTGSDTCPNVAAGDDSTLMANTDFVQTRWGGLANITLGAANHTLIQSEWGVGILVFTGTLTSNVAVIFPNRTGAWLVYNKTIGSFTLTCKTAAGVGVVVNQSTPNAGVWCDGTDVHWQNTPFVIGGTGVTPGTYVFPTINVDTTGRIASISSGAAVTSFNTRNGAVSLTAADIASALGYTPVGEVKGVLPDSSAIPNVVGFSTGAQVFRTPGAFTFNVPTGVTAVKAKLWGGGGGSGGSLLSGSISGPGAGGGYSEGIISVTPGGTLSGIVGGAGAAGSSTGPTPGGAGGTTTVSSFVATGGGGGQPQAGVGANVSGSAGTGSGGTINFPGTPGSLGFPVGSNSYAGIGGASYQCGMNEPLIGAVAASGKAGVFPGQGATGCINGSNGAAGAAGMVVIEW